MPFERFSVEVPTNYPLMLLMALTLLLFMLSDPLITIYNGCPFIVCCLFAFLMGVIGFIPFISDAIFNKPLRYS